MPFQIIRNDITRVKADAIVNTANPRPKVGWGTDTAVYKAAGEEQLLAERRKIGDIAPGNAVHTPAFRLDAKYIIHTVGPVWVDGGHQEAETLRSCYENSLKLAAENGCRSIAFSCISTGVYGYPHEAAAGITVETVRAWNGDLPEEVIFCCFSNEMLKIYESKGVPVISVSHHSA